MTKKRRKKGGGGKVKNGETQLEISRCLSPHWAGPVWGPKPKPKLSVRITGGLVDNVDNQLTYWMDGWMCVWLDIKLVIEGYYLRVLRAQIRTWRDEDCWFSFSSLSICPPIQGLLHSREDWGTNISVVPFTPCGHLSINVKRIRLHR